MQKKLLDLIISQFKLDINSEHGLSHWRRVEKIGNYLFRHTKENLEIINFFAYFHDSKRENNGYDPEHGLRASFFIKWLYNKNVLNISKNQLDRLVFACEHHNDSKSKSNDITIQICWDADRLDLWRVGIVPVPSFLNTNFAKREKTIEFSRHLSRK